MRWERIIEEHIYRHQHMLPWAIRRESFPPCHCPVCEQEREKDKARTMVPGSEDDIRQALRKALCGYIGKPVDPTLLAEIEQDVVDRLDTMVPGLTKSELEDMAKRGGSPPPSSSNVIRRT